MVLEATFNQGVLTCFEKEPAEKKNIKNINISLISGVFWATYMSFLGIFFKTHHIDSDVKMLCKTVMEKCVLKLTNQEEKYSFFSSLLLWYSY